ncbi:MAG TPA: glycosyltransferase family 2 protein [Anaerolineales bacterium]
MSAVLDAFRSNGRLNKPLLTVFTLIAILLLINAFLHDPQAGYDAQDHLHYVLSLADSWQLPTRAQTGQYYSPPLPYFLPAVLTTLQLGLWKALKAGQLLNALLGIGLLYYLIRICEVASPGNTRLKVLSLGMLGLMPVFYRSFALVRGEPYLAFLGVFIAFETLEVFLRRQFAARHVFALGIALGLAVLARQWGFFLLPPVLIFALWCASRADLFRSVAAVCAIVLLTLLVGGWFYLHILDQYGTLTAFDRPPEPLTAAHASSLLGVDASALRVFSDPVRPSLEGRLLPIFYADAWGDYWAYFLIYARNTYTGKFEDGAAFETLTRPDQFSSSLVTNRFVINRYLAALDLLDLIPTALLLAGFLSGAITLLRFLGGRAKDDDQRTVALLSLLAGTSLLGFLWFVLRYQSTSQAGDLIKTTYILQAFPALAFLAGSFIDKACERRKWLWRPLGVFLSLLFIVEIPAFITHYVHLSASAPTLWFGLSTLLFLAALILTYWIHTRAWLEVVVEPVAAPGDGPLISVCIPARNEENNIRRCVEAVLAQTYPHFEAIVLDDRSTDGTPAILKEAPADARLQVLRGAELPEGWAGKPHALIQAVAAARGDWLCFLDADTFLAPEALAACHQKALSTSADLFTILTRQITGTFWEKVIMPLVMTALSVGFPPRLVNDPKHRIAVANGQFILIKRSVYEALGGHERIKDKIVDDKALSELVKWNGYRLILADGRHVASTRMYSSLPQMWEGWTKNIYLGLREQLSLILLGAFGGTLLVLAALFLPVWPVLGLEWYLHGGGGLALAVLGTALTAWAVVLYARAGVARAMNISRWYAFTLPLGAGVFAAMMVTSAWKVVTRRGVTWRGRHYNLA